METELWIGVLLSILGGIMMGNYMLPLKYMREWRWENAWLVYSIVGLVAIPWSLAFLTVPHLSMVFNLMKWSQLAVPFCYGVGWGVANVLFGLAAIRIGMALAFAITIGLSSALGTLIPLLLQHHAAQGSARENLIFGGVVIMLAGITSCSWAGRQRELAARLPASKSQEGEAKGNTSGLFMAFAAGLLAPMMNYALAFGGSIVTEAARQGAAPANATYALWPLVLGGGLIANGSYSLYLLTANKTWCNFRMSVRDIVPSTVMGTLFMGAVSVYGMGTTHLGPLGAAIGWALFQVFMIMAANVSGMILGEWKGLQKGPTYALWSGLALLALATAVISYGNQ